MGLTSHILVLTKNRCSKAGRSLQTRSAEGGEPIGEKCRFPQWISAQSFVFISFQPLTCLCRLAQGLLRQYCKVCPWRLNFKNRVKLAEPLQICTKIKRESRRKWNGEGKEHIDSKEVQEFGFAPESRNGTFMRRGVSLPWSWLGKGTACFFPLFSFLSLAKKRVDEIQSQSPGFHSARRTQSDGLFNQTN